MPHAQYNMVPLPHAVNPPFIPRHVSPSHGPIITIPPIRTQLGAPLSYHPSNPQIIYPNRIMTQQIVDNRQNAVHR